MRGLKQTISVLVIFAAAAACAPQYTRRYLQDLRSRGILAAAAAAAKHHHANRPQLLLPPPLQSTPEDDEAVNEENARADAEAARSAAGRTLSERAVRAAGMPTMPDYTPEDIAKIEEGFAIGKFDPETFNPTPYERGTPEYSMAMINFLLKMGQNGHSINQIQLNQPLADIHRELQDSRVAGHKDPLVCKTVPYNICYRLDKNGVLHPIGNRRPVRILRVY